MWLNLRGDVEAIFSRLSVFEEFTGGFRIIDATVNERLRNRDTPERSRARSRAWKARNRERVAAYARARYAARKAAR